MKGGKSEESFTFKTAQQAAQLVDPLIIRTIALRRKLKVTPAPGWFNRLRNWLMREERGNFNDNRTPYFGSLTYAAIAGLFIRIVKNDLSRSKSFPLGKSYYAKSLYAVEEHQADMIGARGIFPPASTWMDDKIAEVWKDKPPLKGLDLAALNRALEWLATRVKAGSIRVPADGWLEGYKDAATERETDKSLNTDTNSCFATYVSHWFVRPEMESSATPERIITSKIIRKDAEHVWKQWWNQDWRKCNTIFVATASQRTNVASGHKPKEDGSNVATTPTGRKVLLSKLRAVCAMPKVDTVVGKPLLNRLLDAAREIRNPDGSRIFAALMHPAVIDKNMEHMLNTAAKLHVRPLGTDFSGYDASVAPWLALRTAEAVSRWMDTHTANLWMNLIYTEFYRTMCITPDKIFPIGPSSVKSGGITTNFIDSCVNLVSQRYGLEAGYYKSIACQAVQGDDAILIGEGITPQTFEKCVSTLGFEGNASKQYFEPDSVSFCQKIYFRGLPGGIYPICRAVASAVSLEDEVKIETEGNYKYVLAYRTCCRLDTACFNPCFVSLVQEFKRQDPIHLGAEISASRLARLAGSYAKKLEKEKFLKPWKAGTRTKFDERPVNRVLRGDLPPRDAKSRFRWVYGIDYDSVAL